MKSLKLDLVNLGLNLLTGLMSLFGESGPTEFEIVRQEIEKLRSELKAFEGATLSRLDGLKTQIAHFADETRRSLKTIDSRLRSIESNQADTLATVAHMKVDAQLDRSKETHKGRLKREADVIDAADSGSKMPPLAETLGLQTSDVNIPLEPDKHFYPDYTYTSPESAAIPPPLDDSSNERDMAGKLNEALFFSLYPHEKAHTPWPFFNEVVVATHAKLKKELKGKLGTLPNKTDIDSGMLKHIAAIKAGPPVLAGVMKTEYARLVTSDTPENCRKFAASITRSYESLSATENLLPKDGSNRVDLLPAMGLARDYLRNLRNLENRLYKERSLYAHVIDPTALRSWARSSGDGAAQFFAKREGSIGIAACKAQTVDPRGGDSGKVAYPILDVRALNDLGFKFDEWVDLISDEALHTYYSFGGELKFCYEWVRRDHDVRYEQDGRDLKAHMNQFVGIKLKVLYAPPGISSSNHLNSENFERQIRSNSFNASFPTESPQDLGHDYLVLQEDTYFGTKVVDNLYTEKRIAKIRKPKESPAIVIAGLDKRPELAGAVKDIYAYTGPPGASTSYVFDGYGDGTNIVDAHKEISKTFHSMASAPSAEFPDHRSWGRGLINAIKNRTTPPTIDVLEQTSILQSGAPRDIRKQLPSFISDPTKFARSKSLSEALWQRAKQHNADLAEAFKKTFENPESDIQFKIRALEGSRKNLEVFLRFAYGDNIPKELEARLSRLPSLESISKQIRELKVSGFKNAGADLLLQQEKYLSEVLQYLSDPNLNFSKRTKSYLDTSADFAYEKLQKHAACKAYVQAVTDAKKSYEARTLREPERFIEHGFYSSRKDQGEFADSVHWALSNGVPIDKLLGKGIDDLAFGRNLANASTDIRKDDKIDEGTKNKIGNPLSPNAGKLLREEILVEGWGNSKPVAANDSPEEKKRITEWHRRNLEHRINALFNQEMAKLSAKQKKALEDSGFANFKSGFGEKYDRLKHFSQAALHSLEQIVAQHEKVATYSTSPTSVPDFLGRDQSLFCDPEFIARASASLRKFMLNILLENHFRAKIKESLAERKLPTELDSGTLALLPIDKFDVSPDRELDKLDELLVKGEAVNPGLFKRHDTLKHLEDRTVIAAAGPNSNWHAPHKEEQRTVQAGFVERLQSANADEHLVGEMDSVLGQLSEKEIGLLHPQYFRAAGHTRVFDKIIDGMVANGIPLLKLGERLSTAMGAENGLNGVLLDLADGDETLMTEVENLVQDAERKATQTKNHHEARDLSPEEVSKLYASVKESTRPLLEKSNRRRAIGKLSRSALDLRTAWELAKKNRSETENCRDRVHAMIGGTQAGQAELEVIGYLEEVQDKSVRRLEDSIKALEKMIADADKHSLAELARAIEINKPKLELEVQYFPTERNRGLDAHTFRASNAEEFKDISMSARVFAEEAVNRAMVRTENPLINLLSDIARKK